MTINRKICPVGLKNNPNKKLASVSFITVHCTGNYNASATAKSHAGYLSGGSGGAQASWHYTVDGREIWQHFEDNQVCWHAGDGSGPGNTASVGLEICVNDKSGFRQACENAAWLVAELLEKHNLGIDKVVQHNRWSGKNCPAELRSGAWGVTWDDFIGMVRGNLNTAVIEIPIIGNAPASREQAEAWAKSMNATDTFVSLARKYWDYALSNGGVNPLIAFCQAALETGYGKFGGVLDESFHNPYGMKTAKGGGDYDMNAHERFASWEDGVKAHLEHLALYAGAVGYPKSNSYDPRHFPYLLGKGKTLKSMSEGWCPGNKDYAAILKGMMDKAAVAKVPAAPAAMDVPSAIAVLVKHGVINSPDYWLANYSKLQYLDRLIIGMAAEA